jgi:hypothetical protein
MIKRNTRITKYYSLKMLAQKIGGLGNLLRNKIAHEVVTYYNNDPHDQPPDLLPLYMECMALEFGALADILGVQATLQALAIWTSTAVHHTNPGGRRECVYQQVERQMMFFGTLFPAIVQALPDDDND